jgi:hypothetical protein
MNIYTIVLFLHLVAVAGAFSVATLMHFGLTRMQSASDVARARESAMLLARSGHFMPLMGLALLVTGAYMTQTTWTWTTPWIDVSIAGLLALQFIGGKLLKPRLMAVGRRLAQAGNGPLSAELATAVRDPFVHTLMIVEPALALSIMLVMVTKPGMAAGIAEVLITVAIGALWATRHTGEAPATAAAPHLASPDVVPVTVQDTQ